MAAWRRRTGSVLCPGCGKLVGVRDEVCLNCGRRHPAMFGFAALLRLDDERILKLLIGANGVLFVLALALSFGEIGTSGFLGFLSPSSMVLYYLGAAGSIPVFEAGKWYTVFSAGWLHGSLLHIGFNMYWLWNLFPAVSRGFGVARTLLIYQASAGAGFLLTSFLGAAGLSNRLIGGAALTVGASASVCGLLGALLYYGRRTSDDLARTVWRYAIFIGIFGLLVPGIDNAAHLGGFLGGYLVASRFGVFSPERGKHALWALGLLAVSLLAIVRSALG